MTWLLIKYYTARYNTIVIKLCLNRRKSKELASKIKLKGDSWLLWAQLFHQYVREYRLEKSQEYFRKKLDEAAVDALIGQ